MGKHIVVDEPVRTLFQSINKATVSVNVINEEI